MAQVKLLEATKNKYKNKIFLNIISILQGAEKKLHCKNEDKFITENVAQKYVCLLLNFSMKYCNKLQMQTFFMYRTFDSMLQFIVQVGP